MWHLISFQGQNYRIDKITEDFDERKTTIEFCRIDKNSNILEFYTIDSEGAGVMSMGVITASIIEYLEKQKGGTKQWT